MLVACGGAGDAPAARREGGAAEGKRAPWPAGHNLSSCYAAAPGSKLALAQCTDAA